MPLDQARWMIDIQAADKTAAAFRSLDQRMKQTQTLARATGRDMSAGFQSAGGGANFLVGLFGRLAPAIAATSVAWKVWSAGMAAADLGEQAEQIGLTTDQLQAYRFAAVQSAVTNEQLDGAMMKLARSMGEARDGGDDMIAKFDKLGVKLLDSHGALRKVGDVTPEVARGLLSIGSETERNALMMDLFGRSGARMVTVLNALAQGNNELIDAAKAQNAIVSPENSAKWDALSDAMARSGANVSAMLATLTAPAAYEAANLLKRLEVNAAAATKALNALPADAGFMQKLDALFGGRQGTATMGGLRLSTPAEEALDRLEAEQKKLQKLQQTHQNNPERGQALAVQEERVRKLEAAYKLAAQEAKNAADMQRLLGNEGAPGKSAPASGGVGQPTGKAAAKAGAAAAATLANKQLAESQKALDELVSESMKQFEAAQAIMIRYGDGTLYAATETEKLNQSLDFIKDPAVITRAQQEIADRADDMNRAFIGAQGGFDAFLAGLDQGFTDLSRVNTEFEIGKRAVDLLSESIDILAGVSNRSFGQIALDFALMVAKMEAQAAASQVWKAIGGFSGITGFIGSLFGSGGGSVTNVPAFGAGFGDWFSGAGFAEGGRPPVGMASIVGERGPELFVPDRAGTILPNGALGRGGGSATVVNVYQTIHVGEFVTSTQYRQGLIAVEKSAREGARQGIIADGRRGDPRLVEALR